MTERDQGRTEQSLEVETLRARLAEAEETLRAIRSGEIDALVVSGPDSEQVFTLKTADHAYRVLIEEMNQGAVTLTGAGVILYCNRRFAEMVKMPMQQVVGTSIQPFVPTVSQPLFQALLRQGQAGDGQGEITLRAGDGTLVPVYLAVNALPEQEEAGVCLVATDLTEQKRNEEVVAAEKLARSILDQAAEAIVVCDESGRIIQANQAAHRLCGENPILQPFESAFPLRHSPGAVAISGVESQPGSGPGVSLSVAQGGGVLHGVEVGFHRKDGMHHHLLLSAGPLLNSHNHIVGCVVTLTEITERTRLEEELRRRTDQLVEAGRRKDEFLAMLAHELRNPLAPIRHALHLLHLHGVSGPAMERAREVADLQVQHMARLVDDLLDVSRITRGKIQLRKEPVDLALVVARVVEATRPLMEAHGHDLAVSLPTKPVGVEADVTRLEQILANLLNNAAKYTEDGGRIWLTVERDGPEVALRVRDNGIGIPVETLPHVFDMFAQAERSLDRSQGGLGIGLTLVRRLVEMHGGSVHAASAGPGQGSEFVLRLPVLPETLPERITGKGKGGAATPFPNGTPKRVLLVEDHVEAAEMLTALLQAWGHQVRVVHDGPAALEAARVHRPEVVLLDIGLPGMNGYQVAQQLRHQPGLEKTLLVALTGYGQEDDRRRSQEAGFDRHLVKPVDPEALELLLAQSEWLTSSEPLAMM